MPDAKGVSVTGETGSALPSVPLVLNTSDNDIRREFFEPCLKWASSYDRGVGFFSSGWLKENAVGMGHFAAAGGRARWLASPILTNPEDAELFRRLAETSDSTSEALVKILGRNVESIVRGLEEDTLNTIAWLVFDKIIEFRFAVPTKALEGGDFHDKFGVFSDSAGNVLSFNGSQNDSLKGFVNYESFKVFPSWEGLGAFAEEDSRRPLCQDGGDS